MLHRDTTLGALITHTFATVEAEDLDALLRVFADDVDAAAHAPATPHAAIRRHDLR